MLDFGRIGSKTARFIMNNYVCVNTNRSIQTHKHLDQIYIPVVYSWKSWKKACIAMLFKQTNRRINKKDRIDKKNWPVVVTLLPNCPPPQEKVQIMNFSHSILYYIKSRKQGYRGFLHFFAASLRYFVRIRIQFSDGSYQALFDKPDWRLGSG